MKDRIEKLGQIAKQSANSAGRNLLQVQHLAHDVTQTISQTVSKTVSQTLSQTLNQNTKQEAINKISAATNATLSTAITASKSLQQSVQQSISDVIEHETTQALMVQVKETSHHIAESASEGAKFVSHQIVDGVKKIDDKLEENHIEIKEKTETVSMGLGIAAGVAAGAAIVGPPIVVAAAPVIGAAATVTGAVAGTAYFYSKWKSKKAQEQMNENRQDDTVASKNLTQDADQK